MADDIASGQIWEVISQPVMCCFLGTWEETPLELGTKFVIEKCGGDGLDGNLPWWMILVWGNRAGIFASQILFGCQLL